MYLSELSTPRLLDAIKSRLDDYRADEVLTHEQWTRITSPRRMLRAVNEADIQLCGDLKLEMQVVVYLPGDTSVVHTREASFNLGQHGDAIQEILDKEPDGGHHVLFGKHMYRNIGTLRSQYIVGYKNYPVGNSAPIARYAVVPFTAFQKTQAGQPYYDDKFGVLPTAHVDHGRGIIHLSRVQKAGTFLTFKAHVLPDKIDFTGVVNTEEAVQNAYTTVTPTYAERALVLTALCELLPETSPIYDKLEAKQFEAFRRVKLRVPYDSSVKKVESWL